ncbi:MFS transporter [Kitasatospora sp. NPDC051853]|uniref:MFS transporter n=1 Tax=Kitasatospora sp. NPDC051853 TaxID=3364058 RepID=UPI00378DCFC2
MTTLTGPAAATRVSRRQQLLVLTGSITGAAVVALDGTVLTVAQPTLRRDLSATFAQVQWTSTAYLIAVTSLLVFAGRLGDRYGQRQVFAVGAIGFGAASAAVGCAPSIGWVIALRAVQGVFGALLQPATLGLLRAAYPPDRLGTPIAVRTAAIGLAAAAGPVIGGALTTHLGWRTVLFLGVVPALAVGALALAVRLPEPTPASPSATAAAARPGLDLPGAALLALTLAGLVHTLTALPHPGAAAPVLTAVAALLLLRHERRTAHPLLPAALLRTAPTAPALAILVSASATVFGSLYLVTYLLQDTLGLSALDGGLRGLPLALAMVGAAPATAALMRRHGPRRTAAPGLLLIAAGALLLSRLAPGTSWSGSAPGFLLLGAGFGAVMVTGTAVVVRRAAVADAGIAGGLQQTAMNLGPALGIAAATTLTALGISPAATVLALAAAAAASLLLTAGLPRA